MRREWPASAGTLWSGAHKRSMSAQRSMNKQGPQMGIVSGTISNAPSAHRGQYLMISPPSTAAPSPMPP